MMLRRSLFCVAFAFAICAALPTSAFAFFGVHGAFTGDTDACAGCHRAHTSMSSITWTDNFDGTTQHSALLVSSATSIQEFCMSCHGADAQGADTNVIEGIYEGTLYGESGGILNGGGFETVGTATVSSTHVYTTASWGAWGGGTFGSATSPTYVPTNTADDGNWLFNTGKTRENIVMDCVTCHDPHGSSNYRILKDTVYGNRVGGYYDDGSGFAASQDPTPTPWVTSVETGYPDGGWRIHAAGVAQMELYQPDFTRAFYAQPTTQTGADVSSVLATNKGMSGWCSGCHAVYNSKSSTYNAGDVAIGDPAWNPTTMRHRHPMNVPLSNFNGQRSLIVTGNPLPLAHDPASEEGSTAVNDLGDYVECLTCHRAHGTSAIMTGYANSISNMKPAPNTGTGGTPPANSTALLRGDNRYVCEACHNK